MSSLYRKIFILLSVLLIQNITYSFGNIMESLEESKETLRAMISRVQSIQKEARDLSDSAPSKDPHNFYLHMIKKSEFFFETSPLESCIALWAENIKYLEMLKEGIPEEEQFKYARNFYFAFSVNISATKSVVKNTKEKAKHKQSIEKIQFLTQPNLIQDALVSISKYLDPEFVKYCKYLSFDSTASSPTATFSPPQDLLEAINQKEREIQELKTRVDKKLQSLTDDELTEELLAAVEELDESKVLQWQESINEEDKRTEKNHKKIKLWELFFNRYKNLSGYLAPSHDLFTKQLYGLFLEIAQMYFSETDALDSYLIKLKAFEEYFSKVLPEDKESKTASKKTKPRKKKRRKQKKKKKPKKTSDPSKVHGRKLAEKEAELIDTSSSMEDESTLGVSKATRGAVEISDSFKVHGKSLAKEEDELIDTPSSMEDESTLDVSKATRGAVGTIEDEAILQQQLKEIDNLEEIYDLLSRGAVVNYRKLLKDLKRNLTSYNYTYTEGRGNIIKITFKSPLTEKPVIIFYDKPHGTQLKKRWPAWRYNIKEALERAGFTN